MSTSSSVIALQSNEAQLVESTEAVASSEIAVSVRNLGKSYRLWNNPKDRLKQPLRSMFSRWFPMPDRQYFNEFWALRDINFDVKKGETLGIIGRNGSGKSTLLQILCGTLAPTCGSYETRGRVAALLELGSGFNPEFTGRDNVYMNASILGLTKDEIDERYESIVEFADIDQFIDQPVKSYSSGMVVRLAFAVAISVDPDILVVDEALAVGDIFFVQKCMRVMRHFRQRGTLIFVSHDTGAVLNLCDKAVLLENGCIKKIGIPKDICAAYHVELYSAEQEVDMRHDHALDCKLVPAWASGAPIDQRQQFLNKSKFRNDMEMFAFAQDSDAFGTGMSKILEARFFEPSSGRPISWLVGGEKVTLAIKATTSVDLYRPILGFLLKDRLGQVVFGDNTYFSYRFNPVFCAADSVFQGSFTFRMPILPVGDYVVDVAVADGVQDVHVQHHWMNSAITFKSHTSSVCHGVIHIPMEEITLQTIDVE